MSIFVVHPAQHNDQPVVPVSPLQARLSKSAAGFRASSRRARSTPHKVVLAPRFRSGMGGRASGMPTLPRRSTSPSRSRLPQTLSPRRSVTPRTRGLPTPAKTLRPSSLGSSFRNSPAHGRDRRWSGSSGVDQPSTNRTEASAPLRPGQHNVSQNNPKPNRAPTQQAVAPAPSVAARIGHVASRLMASVLSRPPRDTASVRRSVAKSAGLPGRSSTSAKPAASRNPDHPATNAGPSWFGWHGTPENLLKPFAEAAIGALGGGVLTSLVRSHLWPQRKVEPIEAAPQPEPQPDKSTPPSFTAHLGGWDQALISIRDARHNNIPKKPLLPVR